MENLQMVDGKGGGMFLQKGATFRKCLLAFNFILPTEWMPSKRVVKTEDLSQSSSMLQSG